MSNEPGKDNESLEGVRQLVNVVARLRGEGGCPWDREQTLESLKPFLVEECYELLEALDEQDPARHREELGDVLLQIALQARIREEQGDFGFDDVAAELARKLIRRHPHVFGDVDVSDSEHVLRNWEKIKATEKAAERESVLSGLPRQLPALLLSQRVQSRAARVGFDWERSGDVVAKIREELEEVEEAAASGDAAKVADEIGDLLFAVVNLSRFYRVDAESALRGTIRKFTRRFKEIERRVKCEGRGMSDCTLAELDALWDAIKAEERAEEETR